MFFVKLKNIVNKKAIRLFPLAIIIVFTNCTNELVFSELVNTRLEMRLLGTYESNGSYDFQNLYTDNGVATEVAGLAGSQFAIDNAALTTQAQLKQYIDLAEVRLATGTGKPADTISDEYWQFPNKNRTLMCSQELSNNGRIFNNCSKDGGVQKLSDFFSTGAVLKTEDIGAGTYPHVGVYFRRYIVDPSYSYAADTGNSKNTLTAAFENLAINGSDIEPYYQSNLSSGTTPLLFPLERTDQNIIIFGDDDPFVVEVRVFLKNLFMKHMFKLNNVALTFVGPSDWRANHNYDSSTEAGLLGGNFTLAARSYKPSNVGSIQVNSNLGAYPNYYAVVNAGETFNPLNRLPLAATRADVGLIQNLPPGNYDLYRTCDKLFCNATDCNQAGTDGYPETAQLCTANVSVTNGVVTSAAGCAGTCP